jgi:hypothetical protein
MVRTNSRRTPGRLALSSQITKQRLDGAPHGAQADPDAEFACRVLAHGIGVAAVPTRPV